MFVYYFSRIPVSYELAAQMFRRQAAAWTEEAVVQADADVNPRVRCGSTVERQGRIALPVRVEGGVSFSRLDADIELALVRPELSQLSLRGSYDSTTPASGATDDWASAEGYVRDLVDTLSSRLEASETA